MTHIESLEREIAAGLRRTARCEICNAHPQYDCDHDRQKRLLDLVSEIAAAGCRPTSLPVRQSFSISGSFRVYFNGHQAAPPVWCVALGDTFELAVTAVEITAPVRTVYAPKATPDDEGGRPSAWLEVSGTLTVDGSSVRITL